MSVDWRSLVVHPSAQHIISFYQIVNKDKNVKFSILHFKRSLFLISELPKTKTNKLLERGSALSGPERPCMILQMEGRDGYRLSYKLLIGNLFQFKPEE